MRDDEEWQKKLIQQLSTGSEDLVDAIVQEKAESTLRAIDREVRRFLADHQYGVAFITRYEESGKIPWSTLAKGLDIQPGSLRRAYNRHWDDAVQHCRTWWARLNGPPYNTDI